jgi:hypothetical protein
VRSRLNAAEAQGVVRLGIDARGRGVWPQTPPPLEASGRRLPLPRDAAIDGTRALQSWASLERVKDDRRGGRTARRALVCLEGSAIAGAQALGGVAAACLVSQRAGDRQSFDLSPSLNLPFTCLTPALRASYAPAPATAIVRSRAAPLCSASGRSSTLVRVCLSPARTLLVSPPSALRLHEHRQACQPLKTLRAVCAPVARESSRDFCAAQDSD